MIRLLLRILSKKPLLSDLSSQCVIEGNIKFISYNYNNEEVGYIKYDVLKGKICLFFITNDKYRNIGLGTQILNYENKKSMTC